MRIYIVRHGETCHNRKKLFQADDEPLSDLGKEQASCTADKLSKSDIDFVITSSLLRARQTGEIIASKLCVDLESKDFFNEFKWPSDLVNKWRYSPHSLYVAILIFINTNVSKWCHFDGENMYRLDERARKAVSYLENKDKDTFVVITHRGMYALLLERMRKRNSRFGLYKTILNIVFNGAKNTEITVCDYDGEKWSIEEFEGETCT